MSNRKEITKNLSNLLEKYINPTNDPRIYYAKEVTFNYGTVNECRIDYMQFCPKNNSISGIEQGIFKAFEIKSSIEDFNSGHGCNWNIADKSYLVTTKIFGLFEAFCETKLNQRSKFSKDERLVKSYIIIIPCTF